jgi:hypothetical protein
MQVERMEITEFVKTRPTEARATGERNEKQDSILYTPPSSPLLSARPLHPPSSLSSASPPSPPERRKQFRVRRRRRTEGQGSRGRSGEEGKGGE